MKKTLEECIEQYKFYSGKYCDSIYNHEERQASYYFDKICTLELYVQSTYNVDIFDQSTYNVDLSDVTNSSI